MGPIHRHRRCVSPGRPAVRWVGGGVLCAGTLAFFHALSCNGGSPAASGGADGSVDGATGDAGNGSSSSGGGSDSGSGGSGSSSSGGGSGSGSGSSGASSGGGSSGGGGKTFSTDFPTVENPISQGGQFITATSPMVNWTVMVGGCGCKPAAPVAVTSPGLAQSPTVANNVGDALAVLTGSWGADQTASAVVANLAPTANGYEEVELHLRVDPATGKGYEITWGYNHNYILIVTWNGGMGNPYTELVNQSDPSYTIAPGDTIKATIVGNVITMFINGKQIYQYTDAMNSFTSGNPGFGFNEGPAGNYGFSHFSASSP